MLYLYIRHFESEKNILHQFSSINDAESLTEIGRREAMLASLSIQEFVKKNSLSIMKVYCADSVRARTTAGLIAQQLGIQIQPCIELRSNNSGALRGKNEKEALACNEVFMKQLKLFRSGIFSSYDFVKVDQREDKRDFEKRVNQCISEAAKDGGQLHIFVLHHSSLTAAVIHEARRLYKYPESFYGHVSCELGNCYLISDEEIILCNEPITKLAETRLC